ncbi:MAG: helix-turn-helix transcriptional regulator [Syntrophobacteraceae bacterium]
MTLLEARFQRRLTQLDLRLKTGIHQSRISMIENGYVAPRDDERHRLAKALGLRPEQIAWPELAGVMSNV